MRRVYFRCFRGGSLDGVPEAPYTCMGKTNREGKACGKRAAGEAHDAGRSAAGAAPEADRLHGGNGGAVGGGTAEVLYHAVADRRGQPGAGAGGHGLGILVVLVSHLAELLCRNSFSAMATQAVCRARCRVMERLSRRSMKAYLQDGTGEMQSCLTNEMK